MAEAAVADRAATLVPKNFSAFGAVKFVISA